MPKSTGRVGVVGFCFGGGIANTLAVRMGADLAAAVPFYGGAPAAADVPKIKAAVLVHHGEADTRLVEAWPAYEAALKANKVRTRATSIRRRSTASTTTRRRATTRPPPSSRGSARSTGSTSTPAPRNRPHAGEPGPRPGSRFPLQRALSLSQTRAPSGRFPCGYALRFAGLMIRLHASHRTATRRC